jgi:probable rRNA maturation factor
MPADEDLLAWVSAALDASHDARRALVIRAVDETESRQINHRYRQHDRATNVLSFPAELDTAVADLLVSQDDPLPLGDIVICAPLVAREAREQGKTLNEHWAHLVVHGILHLLGYDHQQAAEARIMESRERDILGVLGFADPYAPR